MGQSRTMLNQKMLNTNILLSSYINVNRKTIKCQKGLGFGLAVFGLAIVLAGAFWPGKIADKIIPIFTGISISAFTGFPIKEIRTRQEKIEIIETIQNKSFVSQEDELRVKEILWKALEKTIVG
jgi:hypothetical protein